MYVPAVLCTASILFFCIGTAIYYFQKGGISMELQVTNNFSDITSEILALAK